MNEQHEAWEPLPDAAGEFFILWFEHRPATGSVLEIERADGGPILRIWFDGAIAFRQHPHDIMMVSWWQPASLFRVARSAWAEWLERESQGIWRAAAFNHYGCRAIDGCYEVLSAIEPRAEWIARAASLNPHYRSR